MGRKPKTEFNTDATSQIQSIVRELIKYHGGMTALGNELATDSGTVSRWAHGIRKPIPIYKGLIMSLHARMIYARTQADSEKPITKNPITK